MQSNRPTYIFPVLSENNLINKIVQIGANDGVRFDELRSFIIKSDNVRALLVEPIPEYFSNLKNNYKEQKNVLLENSAISISGEDKFMFKRRPFKFEKGDIVRVKKSGDIGIVIKSDCLVKF